ncbi:MAG: hypothetical protein GYA24_20080 [Candidatus Lokiarchaeota archaeon]|nr:hypothetical protein [Candidatus Lokiarchaeota archaeon]
MSGAAMISFSLSFDTRFMQVMVMHEQVLTVRPGCIPFYARGCYQDHEVPTSAW